MVDSYEEVMMLIRPSIPHSFRLSHSAADVTALPKRPFGEIHNLIKVGWRIQYFNKKGKKINGIPLRAYAKSLGKRGSKFS